MSTEETPLLVISATNAAAETDRNAIYNKYSGVQKRIIVFIVSWAGFIPLFVGGSFTPTIPQIAADLESDGATISWAISLSILVSSFTTMIWASYSGFYGRRPIYLASTPLLCIGSLGVAQATSVPALMMWRISQAFGASGGLSLGPAVIGDIYKLEERGTAMGLFLATSLLGPSLAPLAGGIASRYASWRVLQCSFAVGSFCAFFVMFRFLPETCHPNTRGMDKATTRKWVWLNPFRPVWLLRSPNLLAAAVVAGTSLIGLFSLVMPLAYTIGVQYNITNEAVLAVFFSAAGTGNIVGALLSGRISDNIIIKWRKRRNGGWVPEDRLRAGLFAAGVMVPVSILLSGIVTHYVSGTIGIVINLACLFSTGVGVDMILTPVASYNVDVMHSRSAEIMSAHCACRGMILAVSTMAIVPMINHIGVMATDGIAAIICWLGFGLLWFTVRYGDNMRAWVDVGYSTVKDT